MPQVHRTPIPLRHYSHLSAETVDRLFLCAPQPVSDTDPIRRQAVALGATLYVPATRPRLAEAIRRRVAAGAASIVIDLEDAVADRDAPTAMAQVRDALDEFRDEPVPAALFVRARSTGQLESLTERLTPAHQLTGFVLPKFTAASGAASLTAVRDTGEHLGRRLFAMPILETPDVVYRETRDAELQDIRDLLRAHRDHILAVRLGATDICGLFGIRRDRDLTIYDVRVASDAIAGIVNVLGRAADGFVITGPVWEHIPTHERMFAPTLRHTPFREHNATVFRSELVNRDLDALLREIALDRANGITGKTAIHPAHVAPVHVLSTVTHEEYSDAQDILRDATGGAQASRYRNKMNELRPHRSWADAVLDRAAVFGVTKPDVNFVDLLTAWSEA